MSYPEPLIILFTIFAGLFGIVVGSFLNVCVHRLPKGYLSIVSPGSHCIECGTFLKWYENIPLLSWFFLGGACRYCRVRISIRYLFIEAFTGMLFLLYTKYIVLTPLDSFASFPIVERWAILFVTLYLSCIMIIITFIDLKYRIIPDCITYSGIIIAPFFAIFFPHFHRTLYFGNAYLSYFCSSLFGIFVGGGALYLVGLIGKFFFKKEAMGLGDVKLMACVGGWIGWDAALLIFIMACFIGTLIGIISFIVTKDHFIPFGPSLAIGTLLVLIWKSEICYFLFTQWPIVLAKIIGLSNYPAL